MKTPTNQTYIDRLESCGYSRHRAMRTVYDFLKEFTYVDLEDFLRSLEESIYDVSKCSPTTTDFTG